MQAGAINVRRSAMRGLKPSTQRAWRIMSTYALLVASTLFAAVGQILFKTGASGRVAFVDFINVPVIAGLGLYAASTLLWIYSLSRLPLKNVYPFTALTFVLVYAGAILFIGERPSWRALTGVVIVLGGLFLVISDA